MERGNKMLSDEDAQPIMVKISNLFPDFKRIKQFESDSKENYLFDITLRTGEHHYIQWLPEKDCYQKIEKSVTTTLIEK